MSKSAPTVDEIRKAFADITAALEDAALVATDGQAVTDLANARLTCDQLIEFLESCLRRSHRLRWRLG